MKQKNGFDLRVRTDNRQHMGWKACKKKYPNMRPFADNDGDFLQNSKDCRPLDPTQHSIFGRAVNIASRGKYGQSAQDFKAERTFKRDVRSQKKLERGKARTFRRDVNIQKKLERGRKRTFKRDVSTQKRLERGRIRVQNKAEALRLYNSPAAVQERIRRKAAIQQNLRRIGSDVRKELRTTSKGFGKGTRKLSKKFVADYKRQQRMNQLRAQVQRQLTPQQIQILQRQQLLKQLRREQR